MKSTKCLYRNWSKCNDEFSQEHVLPQSIGGNIKLSNPFVLSNVCANCNSLAGLYVDGPYIRTWFTQSDKSRFALKYLDIESKSIVPLRFIGVLSDYKYKDKICEVWGGPTGDTIFHFHTPYPSEPNKPSYIGVPPLLRKEIIDYGFTFLFVRSNNPLWYPVIFNSFAYHFNNSVNYLGNGLTPNGGGFKDIPSNLEKLKNELKDKLRRELVVGFSFDHGFDTRFLAKSALGFGALLLKKEFENGDFANRLRQLMWEKDYEKRAQIPVKGSGFLTKERVLEPEKSKVFLWPGGHFISVIKHDNEIYLHMILYEERTATIQISNEPDLLDCNNDSGYYYVVVPSLQRAVGPKKLNTYYEHKAGYKDKDLENLENEMIRFKNLPPFEI